MNLILRPVSRWPGEMTPSYKRKPSPFEAGYPATRELLEREVAQLGGREVIVQIGVTEEDFKIDGGLRAHAKVMHPGVIVSFDSRHGPISYATDRFTTRSYRADTHTAWHVNLRAIALGLEALRKVDRYGIANDGEQYTGFKALGSGIPMGAASGPGMTVEDAARLLSENAIESPLSGRSVVSEAQLLTDTPERRALALRLAYRLASQRHHPDTGGNPDAFRRITEARDLLLAGA